MLINLGLSANLHLQDHLALMAALLVSTGFILFQRRRKKTKLSVVLRALFHPRIWLSPSSLMDFKYYFAGIFIFSSGVVYVSLSNAKISEWVYALLNSHIGERDAHTTLGVYAYIIIIFVLYIAIEFGFWIDHYLSHKVPFLWEFHKVHHAATVLTPFTNFRIHPVNVIIFVNIMAVVVGSTNGVIYYVFGKELAMSAVLGTNILLLCYMALYGHLQHSQVWIPFTGWAGKIFLSPAHHQIHHSNTRQHFDKNFGMGLAVFDWIFGTLYVPAKHNERIVFGVDNDNYLDRWLPSLCYPLLYSGRHIYRMFSPSNYKKNPS